MGFQSSVLITRIGKVAPMSPNFSKVKPDRNVELVLLRTCDLGEICPTFSKVACVFGILLRVLFFSFSVFSSTTLNFFAIRSSNSSRRFFGSPNKKSGCRKAQEANDYPLEICIPIFENCHASRVFSALPIARPFFKTGFDPRRYFFRL